jgi:DNA-binding NarL/FixJ family response regulator
VVEIGVINYLSLGMPIRVVFITSNNSELYYLPVHFAVAVPDMIIAGTYPNEEYALELIKGAVPDVVVINHREEEAALYAFLKKIRELLPQTKFVIRSANSDGFLIQRAMNAGVQGVVMLDGPIDKLLKCIRDVMKGAGWSLCKEANEILLKTLQVPEEERDLCAEFNLTERECEVFYCLKKGQKYSEIARELFISQATVRVHVRNLYEKLEVNTRVEAIYKVYPNWP